MLSNILYLLIAIGTGYFIYIYWKKWSLIREDDLSSFKISFKNIKRLPHSILNSIKRIRLKNFLPVFRGINFRRTGKVFRKIKRFLIAILNILKKITLSIKKSVVSMFSKKNSFKNKEKKTSQEPAIVNHESVPEIDFLRESFRSETEESVVQKDRSPKVQSTKNKKKISIRIKPVLNFLKTSSQRIGKVFKRTSKQAKKRILIVSFKTKNGLRKSFSRTKKAVKKIKRKIKIKAIFVFLKELTKKPFVKFNKKNKQDKEIEDRLSEEKDLIVRPEAYLGELLKKTEKEIFKKEKVEKKEIAEAVDVPEDSVKEKTNFFRKEKKSLIQKKIEAEDDKEVDVEDLLLEKSDLSTEKIFNQRDKTEDIVSNETLQKIEDELINQIVEDPKNIEAYKKLGKLYYNQDKYEFAKESFDMAIKLGSGDQKIKDLLKDCEDKE